MSRKPPENHAPNTGSDREKQLEMRVAELEDKLSKLQGLADAYQHASSLTAKEILPGSNVAIRAVLMARVCGDWRLGFILPLSDSPRDFWCDLGKDDRE